MGLFGDKDAADVPDNPFYVAPDYYNCVLSEATRVEKKNPKPEDPGTEGISIKWVVEDDDSDYVGNSLSDWHNIYPDITEDDLDELAPEQRAAVRRDRARMKGRLQEMRLTPDEMDNLLEDGNLDNLVGMTALVEVTESKDKHDPDKTYTNIKSVKRTDLDDDDE